MSQVIKLQVVTSNAKGLFLFSVRLWVRISVLALIFAHQNLLEYMY